MKGPFTGPLIYAEFMRVLWLFEDGFACQQGVNGFAF